MAISIEAIKKASQRTVIAKSKSIVEAKQKGQKSLFLCHSHKDRSFVNGVLNMLGDSGWNVYVDWADASLPDAPSRATALAIKKKIKELDFFLFLATENSIESRWCPWEIGFADGVKNINNILIMPVKQNGIIYGSEYLDLYRHIDMSGVDTLGVWEPNKDEGIYLRDLV